MFCEKSVCVWNGQDFTWESWPERFDCEFYRDQSLEDLDEFHTGRPRWRYLGGEPSDVIWGGNQRWQEGRQATPIRESETPGTASRILNWDLKPIVQQHIAQGINFLCVCMSFGHLQNTLGHFWDNRQQELRTQGSQTGSHLGNRCS